MINKFYCQKQCNSRKYGNYEGSTILTIFFRPALSIGYALIHNMIEFLELVPADSSAQVQSMKLQTLYS